jgi:hypothetical protein
MASPAFDAGPGEATKAVAGDSLDWAGNRHGGDHFPKAIADRRGYRGDAELCLIDVLGPATGGDLG